MKPMAATNDQHFLVDKKAIEMIASEASLNTNDFVLEIGGGTGSISTEIAGRCKKLAIVEKDASLCNILKSKFKNKDNVSVIHGDILNVKIPKFNKIVSSTPYSVIQQIFIRLIKERRHNFDSAVLVVSYSFAKKMVATPDSDYFGAISAMLGAFYDMKEVFQIHKSSFDPQPRVTSACVVLKRKQKYTKEELILQNLFFNNQRKLGNAIMKYFWDSGNTKSNARKMADKLLKRLPKSIAEKKILELTNRDFKELVIALKN